MTNVLGSSPKDELNSKCNKNELTCQLPKNCILDNVSYKCVFDMTTGCLCQTTKQPTKQPVQKATAVKKKSKTYPE